MDQQSRSQLFRLLAERSYREGRFVLSSGATSSFYIDARRTTMSPEGLRLIGTLGVEALKDVGWSPDSVGGLTLGADPISYAVSMASATTSRSIRAFTVRKEAKAHGTGQLIEGPFEPNDSCVVTEDVITSGGSALRAVSAVRAAGGMVLGVLAVVDRQEGGRQMLEEQGLPVIALATLEDIRRTARSLPTYGVKPL